jgi:hypothetical protein
MLHTTTREEISSQALISCIIVHVINFSACIIYTGTHVDMTFANKKREKRASDQAQIEMELELN